MWVYTLVNTDYGGNLLLPHFFNYYHQHVRWGCRLGTAAQGRLPRRRRRLRRCLEDRTARIAGSRSAAPPAPAPAPPAPQGVTWRRFLVVLHHTPGAYSRAGLEDAMGICSGYSVECR